MGWRRAHDTSGLTGRILSSIQTQRRQLLTLPLVAALPAWAAEPALLLRQQLLTGQLDVLWSSTTPEREHKR